MFHNQKDSFAGCSPPKIKNERMENSVGSGCVASQENEWVGVPLERLRNVNIKDIYPPVKPSDAHTVLFKVPVEQDHTPYPITPVDVWDKDYVRLPCSSQCLSPVNETDLRKRWDLICEAYSKPIKTSEELEEAILHYNSKYIDKWSFSVLHYFFSTTLSEEETEHFFLNIFPGIVHLALSLPQLITGGIPLLRQRRTHSVSLTQKQIACLMANAFLCTFPRRNTFKPTSEYGNYPDINFNRMYTYGSGDHVQEKLKCIVNYFRRVCSHCPEGVVTYSRHYVSPNNLPIWSESNSELPQLHVTSSGTIEDGGAGMMELDFANKKIGGGVLNRGCVQEEIRFVISPELIVARLFTECLDDTEAFIITGVERYNKHTGYSNSFTWAGDYVDQTPRDQYGRRLCIVVAVDATRFQQTEKQFTMECINRELNKAYAGFSWGITQNGKETRLNVATGNWGCGAFRGDAHLKALLQLMAAGETGRNIAYFTFGDSELRDKLSNMHKFLVENKVTIGQLWKLLSKYQNVSSQGSRKKNQRMDLYDYIFHLITNGQGLSCTASQFFSVKNKVETPTSQTPMDTSDSPPNAGFSSHEFDSVLKNLEVDNLIDASVKKSKEQIKCSESYSSSGEPMAAESYVVTSKEGRDKCLQRQRDSWARIEESKKDFNEFEIVDDSVSCDIDDSRTKSSADSSNLKPTQIKRKISDYFPSTSKV